MGVLDAAIIVAGTVTIAAGLLLAVRGLQVAHVRFVAAWCILTGAWQVGALFDPELGNRLLGPLIMASILAFAVAYPGPSLRAQQRWLIVWLFIPAVGIIAIGYEQGKGIGSVADGIASMLFLLALFGVPLHLGWRAIRTRSALMRDQLVWLVVPLTFWTIHDSMILLVPSTMRSVWGDPAAAPMTSLLASFQLFGLIVVMGTGLFLGALSFRLPAEKARPARTFALAVAAFFAISIMQFTVASASADRVHSLIDTLFALLLFYGIARYGLVDLRLRMRWSVKQGTIAAVFVAAFFAISESASTFLSETSGSAYFGIIGASLLVFAVAPLQRFAEHLSVRAVPVNGSAESYLTYRRLHIYRAALEGALADGRVNAWEADALRALRTELQVSEEEHRLLESELKLPRGPDGSSAQAEQAT